MKLSIKEITNHFGLDDNYENDSRINKIKTDSREISPGDVFIAIKGENFDGNDFALEALNKGAICAIVSRDFHAHDKIIKVNNTVDFLQDLSKFYLNKFDVKKIGVTGSVGKSTVKEMISSIFETEFNVLKTEGNLNGQLGVPFTIFNMNDDTQIAIFEMGVSIPGEMDRLSDIVSPDFSVINNIGVSHLGNFNTLETTCEEKMKISSEKCVLCLNGDNSELLNFPNKVSKKTVYFGFNGNFEYNAENILSSDNSTEFILNHEDRIKIPCSGIHQVYNALASISVSLEFGIHIESVKKGLLNFRPIPMRQKITYFNEFTLIDDSYNASPDSIKASIKLLESLENVGRNIVVIADILELGSYSNRIHFDVGKYMSSCNIDVLITIGEKAKYIEGGMKINKGNIVSFHFSNNDDVYDKILCILQKNDKILIKGSRGMRTDEIVKKLFDRFGDEIRGEDEKS